MTHFSNASGKSVARVLIGRTIGFRDCAVATLDAMVEQGTMRHLGKGELLARQGTPVKSIFLVVSGSLETCMMRMDGHRHLVGFLQSGDVAGLLGTVDGLGHVHDLRGREAQTAVLLIPVESIHSLRQTDERLGRAIEVQLASRSRFLYERLSADPSMPLESRLARLLLTMCPLYGIEETSGIRLDLKVSQVDLADWLGVSRQRVNAAVQVLKNQQLIQFGYSTIVILDQPGLRALTHL